MALLSANGITTAVACSDSAPIDQPQIASAEEEHIKIEAGALASVLITGKTVEPTTPVDSVEIFPSSVVTDPGETIQLSAQAFGPGGEPLAEVDFIWAMVDPRAGIVTGEGRLQAATRPGVFKQGVSVTGIQNTPEGIRYASASASITIVGEAPMSTLSSVAIIPNGPLILTGQIYRLRAVGFDEDGLVIPGVSFVWMLNEPALGRINDIGYLTVEGGEGIYEGVVSVTGIWSGVKVSEATDVRVIGAPEADDFLSVHALPQRFFLDPGVRLQLRAVALNGLGELVAGTQLRWSMVDSRAGTIDGTGNFIAGDIPGIYTESVKVEAMVPGERGFVRAEDFASVVIRQEQPPRRLNAVLTVPNQVTLAPGGDITLAVKAVDEFGDPAKNVTTTWEVLEKGVGELSVLGRFIAGSAPGLYAEALRASVVQRVGEETITRTRTVDVIITGTLSAAVVHPTIAVIAPGRTVHFSVTGWDENNFSLPGLVVTWSVSADGVGTIDAFGNFTAGQSPGLYQDAIRATVVQRLPD